MREWTPWKCPEWWDTAYLCLFWDEAVDPLDTKGTPAVLWLLRSTR